MMTVRACPHIAIPARDIPEAIEYYHKLHGCRLGRYTDDWAIFNFCEVQLVCHKTDDIPNEPTMYPRHFGVILEDLKDFESIYARAFVMGIKIFQPRFIRFAGMYGEHETFFLQDPSNNVIEFKWYVNDGAIFGERDV